MEEFIRLAVPERWESIMTGRHSGRDTEAEDWASAHIRKQRDKLEMGQGYELSKAALSDVLPPARPYLLNPPKQHPSWGQVFKYLESMGDILTQITSFME